MSTMAEVIAAHAFAYDDYRRSLSGFDLEYFAVCACGNQAIFSGEYSADAASQAHAAHVAEELGKAGYGSQHDAWAAGFKQGGPMHDEHYGEPDRHKINPYRIEAGHE